MVHPQGHKVCEARVHKAWRVVQPVVERVNVVQDAKQGRGRQVHHLIHVQEVADKVVAAALLEQQRLAQVKDLLGHLRALLAHRLHALVQRPLALALFGVGALRFVHRRRARGTVLLATSLVCGARRVLLAGALHAVRPDSPRAVRRRFVVVPGGGGAGRLATHHVHLHHDEVARQVRDGARCLDAHLRHPLVRHTALRIALPGLPHVVEGQHVRFHKGGVLLLPKPQVRQQVSRGPASEHTRGRAHQLV
mmetsp:Transcript_33264/g.83602  ORF Transcript_33264/g.83602 Transcript_33264/m.83602 type:complete len:250 (+) Transcript_33264:1300-2049(+)